LKVNIKVYYNLFYIINKILIQSIIIDDDYCVSDSTLELTPRVDNYCNALIDCDKYFECTEQLCEDKSNIYESQ